MDSESVGEPMPIFYVGHHETTRAQPVSDTLVRHAQDCGYDMLTSPITNSHFHSRVLGLLSAYNQAIETASIPLPAQPLPLIPALENVDSPLHPSDTISQLVTLTSTWIDLASPDPVIAYLSRQVFSLEIAYAAFCGVMNVAVRGPRLSHGSAGISQYARAIKEALSIGSYVNIHIWMPMDGTKTNEDEHIGDLSRFVRPEYANSEAPNARLSPYSAWDAWNAIRSVCRYHSRLSVALDLPRKFPSITLQSRWYAEPIRLINLSESAFLVNNRGSFVLSKPHQIFIFRCLRLKSTPWLLLSDVGPLPSVNDPDMVMSYPSGYLSPSLAADAPSSGSMPPSPTPAEAAQVSKNSKAKSKNDPTPHLSYLRYLQRNQPPKNVFERFGGGYQDYLQSPLQPLTDNLESITYEVFEKDPVKYDWYERAIAQALKDWVVEGRSTSSGGQEVVVAVVGAGRGPLVTRALRASESTGIPIRAYAIEKNPNAYVLLQRHNLEDWQGQVTVVKTDMRAWRGPTLPEGDFGKVDILVSELLGSFADNELSPECLDGVQHVLNPMDGISIPASYTAHLTPISTPRIYADLYGRSLGSDTAAFDIPWVVMLHQLDYLSTLPNQPDASELMNGTKINQLKVDTPLTPNVQLVWEFSHPLSPTILAQASLRRGGSAIGGGGGFTGGDGANEHNIRFSKLTFPIQDQGACHGLAGYFETVLYAGSEGSVELSTNPVTMEEKSKDMISWFPILFPLKTPIQLPPNSELEVSMWRQTDDRKVWYEWMVEAFVNINGYRTRIAISELHSSKSNGCLM
ncbi:protein arginine N-methyltransferase HSL7 [Amniculicola lignicola CBS 123094]|uniref:Protein arginine N-methyltransferase n=1 Tax=Amniculicola lignicola CBS 123094 TaxID=1392246 RepID=A0A6A5WDL3_9PLEO|nr:protein arginine N-methyltransferase HSL7 [Amniculicola lignicola CBS 123094]